MKLSSGFLLGLLFSGAAGFAACSSSNPGSGFDLASCVQSDKKPPVVPK